MEKFRGGPVGGGGRGVTWHPRQPDRVPVPAVGTPHSSAPGRLWGPVALHFRVRPADPTTKLDFCRRPPATAAGVTEPHGPRGVVAGRDYADFPYPRRNCKDCNRDC